MTVKELIVELLEYHPDATILISTSQGSSEISGVDNLGSGSASVYLETNEKLYQENELEEA